MFGKSAEHFRHDLPRHCAIKCCLSTKVSISVSTSHVEDLSSLKKKGNTLKRTPDDWETIATDQKAAALTAVDDL